MKKIFVFLLIVVVFLPVRAQTEPDTHLFYLHGRIIEVEGVQAVSEVYGPYEYEQILDTLRTLATEVHAIVRDESTDFQEFCRRISGQIDSLVASGVYPDRITVIGASKGGVMAMQISSMNEAPVNYLLLGANNDTIERENDWRLHGRVTGIYESSDRVAGKDYRYWIDRSPEVLHFEQVQLSTGFGHGFLYRPLAGWITPLRKLILSGPRR